MKLLEKKKYTQEKRKSKVKEKQVMRFDIPVGDKF
jgi:hypothetical protein